MGILPETIKRMQSSTSLVLLITFAIFIIIFARVNIWVVIEALYSINKLYLIASSIPLIISVIIQIKRWQILLNAMGYVISYSKSFCVIMGALPLAAITPSHAGDVIRAYYLRQDIPKEETIGGVITERMFDVAALIILSLIIMIYYKNYEFILIISSISVILIILLCIVVYAPTYALLQRISKRKAEAFSLSLRKLTRNSIAFSLTSICTIAIWLLSAMQVTLLFYAMDIEVPFLFVMGNIPLAIIIGMIPISFGGMGTRDAMIMVLFAGYGTPAQLVAVGLLFSFTRYWMLSLIGIPFMRRMLHKDNAAKILR